VDHILLSVTVSEISTLQTLRTDWAKARQIWSWEHDFFVEKSIEKRRITERHKSVGGRFLLFVVQVCAANVSGNAVCQSNETQKCEIHCRHQNGSEGQVGRCTFVLCVCVCVCYMYLVLVDDHDDRSI
jgi:hypothetical protein